MKRYIRCSVDQSSVRLAQTTADLNEIKTSASNDTRSTITNCDVYADELWRAFRESFENQYPDTDVLGDGHRLLWLYPDGDEYSDEYFEINEDKLEGLAVTLFEDNVPIAEAVAQVWDIGRWRIVEFNDDYE